MAIDVTKSGTLTFVGQYNSSGNFVAPPTANEVYVVLRAGGGGGGGTNNYPPGYNGTGGGVGGSVGASVAVVPGFTYAVTVGAGGAAGANSSNGQEAPGSGATGGSSTFDGNTLIASGGNGGGRGGQHAWGQSNASPAGNAGGSSAESTLLATAPAGAGVKVSGIVNNNTGGAAGNAAQAGTAGSVQIYAIM